MTWYFRNSGSGYAATHVGEATSYWLGAGFNTIEFNTDYTGLGRDLPHTRLRRWPWVDRATGRCRPFVRDADPQDLWVLCQVPTYT